MRRFINPLLILGMLLFLGAMIFVPSQTVEAQAGVPWTGLFYPTTNFTGATQLVTFPAGLSQSWGAGPPTNPSTGQALPGIPADNFSARFSANTTIQGGLYEFIVVADGGVKFTVNGQTLIDDLGNQGQKTYS